METSQSGRDGLLWPRAKKSKTVLYDGVAWRHQQLHGDIVEIDAKES